MNPLFFQLLCPTTNTTRSRGYFPVVLPHAFISKSESWPTTVPCLPLCSPDNTYALVFHLNRLLCWDPNNKGIYQLQPAKWCISLAFRTVTLSSAFLTFLIPVFQNKCTLSFSSVSQLTTWLLWVLCSIVLCTISVRSLDSCLNLLYSAVQSDSFIFTYLGLPL